MRVRSCFPPPSAFLTDGLPTPRARTMTAPALAAAGAGPARAMRRTGASAVCAVLSAATLAGCALWPAETPRRAFEIAPVYRVDDTPLSAPAYLAAGRYFEGSRNWARAAQAYGKAASRDASSEAAWDGLGRTLAAAGRLDEAEQALRRAVALAPQRARAHNNLAYVLLLKDQPAPALAALDEALRLDPSHAMARENRAEALARIAASGVPATATATSAATAAAAAVTPAAAAATTATAVASPPSLAMPGTVMPDTVGPADAHPAALRTIATTAATQAPPGFDTAPAAPAAPCPVPRRFEVSNGLGATGMAARVDGWLSQHGLPRARLTNQPAYGVVRTRVDYGAGQADAARCVAQALPAGVPSELRQHAGLRGDVRLVIGQDWPARAPGRPERLAGL